MPPPPENFPTGWDSEWQPSFSEAAMALRPEPKPAKKEEPVTPPKILEPAPPVTDDLEAMIPPPILHVPSMYVPLADPQEHEHPQQQITILLHSSSDKETDKRRIKTIYGTLISFHGRDRFSFQIYENGKGHLIDFPNDSTRICPEMLARLKKLIDEESWRVEPILLQ